MTDDRAARQGLPLLFEEDHVCEPCGLVYSTLTVENAKGLLTTVPDRARAIVAASPVARLRVRPDEKTWTPLEYLAHIRDVYVSYTIRLFRIRTEDSPAVEPMFNDLRARRFRYNDLDPAAVCDELSHAMSGFLAEIDAVPSTGWARMATRLPTEPRTARWFVRQATHEGIHHLDDITHQLSR